MKVNLIASIVLAAVQTFASRAYAQSHEEGFGFAPPSVESLNLLERLEINKDKLFIRESDHQDFPVDWVAHADREMLSSLVYGHIRDVEVAIGDFFDGDRQIRMPKFYTSVNTGMVPHPIYQPPPITLADADLRAPFDLAWAVGTIGNLDAHATTTSETHRYRSALASPVQTNAMVVWPMQPGFLPGETVIPSPPELVDGVAGVTVSATSSISAIAVGQGRVQTGERAVMIASISDAGGGDPHATWTKPFFLTGSDLEPVALAPGQGGGAMLLANIASIQDDERKSQLLVLWINSEGALRHKLINLGFSSFGSDILALDDGGVLIAGRIKVRSADEDALVLRLDSEGHVAWIRACGGRQDDAAFFAKAGPNEFYIGGSTFSKQEGYDYVSQDSDEMLLNFQRTGFVFRLDLDGVVNYDLGFPTPAIDVEFGNNSDAITIAFSEIRNKRLSITKRTLHFTHNLGSAPIVLFGKTPWHFGWKTSLVAGAINATVGAMHDNDPALTCYDISDSSRSFNEISHDLVRDWRFTTLVGN